MLKLSFQPPGPALPYWQQFPPIRSVTAPLGRLPTPDWTGREPGPRVTNLGAPYSATHTSPGAPVEPLLCAFPYPLPHSQGTGRDLPSREVPINWSSIARIWACADMAAA